MRNGESGRGAGLEPGAVHLAVPFDEHWQLELDGEALTARPSFGVATAWDVPDDGTGVLFYDTAATRLLLVALQVLLWVAVFFGATRVTVPLGRRRGPVVSDETLIDLDAGPPVPVDGATPEPWVFRDPGLDATGELARPRFAGATDEIGEEDGPAGSAAEEAGDHGAPGPEPADPDEGAGSSGSDAGPDRGTASGGVEDPTRRTLDEEAST